MFKQSILFFSHNPTYTSEYMIHTRYSSRKLVVRPKSLKSLGRDRVKSFCLILDCYVMTERNTAMIYVTNEFNLFTFLLDTAFQSIIHKAKEMKLMKLKKNYEFRRTCAHKVKQISSYSLH